MGKTAIHFLIFLTVSICAPVLGEALAAEDANGVTDASSFGIPIPESPPPAAGPAKKKPVSGINVGDPQYMSEGGVFFISPVTPLTIKVVGGSSGIAKTEIRVDGSEGRPYEPFKIVAEGAHLIEYRSIDNAGNEESPRSFSLSVDGTPPQTTPLVDGRPVAPGRPVLVGKKTSIKLECADVGSGIASVEYRLDQGPWQPYVPFIAPAKGAHTVSYRSTDNVGNREEEKSFTITSEKIPVKTSLVVGEPKYQDKNLLVVGPKTVLTLLAESMSGVASTEYSIDGGPWQKNAPFTLSGEGKHQVAYRSTEDAGVKEAVQTAAITVDGTPPATILSVSGKKIERGDTLASNHVLELMVSAEDTMSPVRSTEYSMNGGNWLPVVPISLDAEGKYEIEYRSTDAVGNTGPAGSFIAIIDKTPPVSEIIVSLPQREIDGLVHGTPSTLFTPKGTDALSGVEKVEYTIDGRDDTRDTVPFNITTPGRYRIDYQAMDTAGNKEPLKTMLVVVDDGPAKGGGRDDGNAANMSEGRTRQFAFDRKSPSVAGQLPAGASFAEPEGSGIEVNAGIGLVGASAGHPPPESAYSDEVTPTSVRQLPVMNLPRQSNTSFWEYVTLGIVNISLILGVMLL